MFEAYYAPATIQNCLEVKAYYGDEAAFLAGGTDLVVKLRAGRAEPKAVVDLSGVDGLDEAVWKADGLHLGAMLRLSALAGRAGEIGGCGVVAQAAGHVSSIQVRNMATLGGNSCNASPSADTVPALLVCDAEVAVAGGEGERRLPLHSFFTGPGATVLRADELVTGFVLPPQPAASGADYQKYAIRGDSDIAIVGVGALLALDEHGAIAKARIAMGAVAATPLRARKAEEALLGQLPSEQVFRQAAQLAAGEASPIRDQRASREYRLEMVRVALQKALCNSASRAAAKGKIPPGQGGLMQRGRLL